MAPALRPRLGRRNFATEEEEVQKPAKEEQGDPEPSTSAPVPSPKRAKKKKEETAAESVGDIEDAQIPGWQRDLTAIGKMRESFSAPVDTMGCDMLADQKEAPEVYRFQVLMSLLLSSQTRDEVTSAAMVRLRKHGCSVDRILETSQEDLEKLLVPVSFYRNKAKFARRVAEILKSDYAGDVPRSFEGLCSLPGIGPKMAHLIMRVAYDEITGIAVDTHVHRVANRLGWVKAKQPKDTEQQLEDMLPRSEWRTVNKLLVGFGQQMCRPVGPRCSDCLLNQTCPSSSVKKTKKAQALVD